MKTKLIATAAAVLVVAATMTMTANTVAYAQEDPALARDLSKQGYELFLASKYDEAVPMLERSQKLAPDPRTLVNLARCEEKLLHFGRALDHLTSARDLARDRKLADMASQIEAMIGPVEARLGRVVIHIASTAPPNTVVRRGAIELPPSALVKGVPADPGEQVFEVSAPGYTTREFRITIVESERHTIEVTPGPALPPAAAAVVTRRDPTPAPSSSRFPGRTVGVIAIAGGGAAVATGLIFGLVAMNGKSAAESAGCIDTRCPDADSAGKRDDAKSAGVASTVLVGAGTAIAVAGLVVFLVSPPRSSPSSASPATTQRVGWVF